MMASWIKMRTDLATDPAVAIIAKATRLNPYAVVGRLHAIWAWADAHTEDGRIVGIDAAWIDKHVGRRGFAGAMVEAGWLAVDADGISLPNYTAHNGTTAKRRVKDAKRKGESRKCPQNVRERADKTGNREEKRREEEKTPPLPPSGGSRDLGEGLCPKVGEAERQAAYDAMNAWSEADRRTPLLTPHGEHTRFWKALDEIADMPKVATPTGLIPAAALVPKAVLVKRSQGTKFKNVAFAVGCVRTLIQEWSVVGVADGANVAETASEKRLRLAREQEGAA